VHLRLWRVSAALFAALVAVGCSAPGFLPVPVGYVTLTVDSVTPHTSIPPYDTPRPGNHFVQLRVTLRSHNGATDADMNPAKFQVVIGTLVYRYDSATFSFVTRCFYTIVVPPNDARSCDIVFQLPAGTVRGTLEYDNIFPAYRARATF
jgi:hypothetical protein